MRRHELTLMSALAMLIKGASAQAGLVPAPDATFSFAPPLSERGEVVELVSAALTPLGFGAGRVTDVRTNGFFMALFSSGSDKDVSLAGPTSCVTVSIYTSRVDKPPERAEAEAQQIMNALLVHLRSVAGEKVLFFRSDTEKGCTHAL